MQTELGLDTLESLNTIFLTNYFGELVLHFYLLLVQRFSRHFAFDAEKNNYTKMNEVMN